jgi:hypothetical protein
MFPFFVVTVLLIVYLVAVVYRTKHHDIQDPL